jgi:hypothetical protein
MKEMSFASWNQGFSLVQVHVQLLVRVMSQQRGKICDTIIPVAAKSVKSVVVWSSLSTF